MKLKRRVSITRVGLLLLLAASIMASAYADAVPLPKALSAFTSDDLSMNEAIQIAQSVACQKRNISVTDIADETIKASFVLLDNGQTAWVVTLFDDAFQDPTDISILISSPDGAILDVQTTNIGYFKTIFRSHVDTSLYHKLPCLVCDLFCQICNFDWFIIC